MKNCSILILAIRNYLKTVTLTLSEPQASRMGKGLAGPNKRFLAALGMTFCILIVLWAGSADAKYSGGTGEPNDPYRIAKAEDLNDIGNHQEDFNKCFLMVADINLADYTGTKFNIIGNLSNPFTGVFNGNSHTIFNFTYTTTGTNYIGLFSYVYGPNAVIKDLTLIDPNVDAGTGYYVGSLVGRLQNGTISGCAVEAGSVSGDDCTGGLVGLKQYGTISNCYAAGTVDGNNCTGGLVGANQYGTISNCYATGNVSGGDYCAGGLVGLNQYGTISNCYVTGNVSGGDYRAGGLVGLNQYGTILNCYTTGSVSGNRYTGGLVGQNDYGTISNCYTTGSVSGNRYTGGLVGLNNRGTILASFWDIETTGQSTSAGGTGLPTAQMRMVTTFISVGWDFVEIWGIGENQTYPFLLTDPAGDLNHDKKVDLIDLAVLASHWLEEK